MEVPKFTVHLQVVGSWVWFFNLNCVNQITEISQNASIPGRHMHTLIFILSYSYT